jgi:cell division protein ZapD
MKNTHWPADEQEKTCYYSEKRNLAIIMADKMITFEQPLNEQIRACLRLEFLFDQLHESIEKPTLTHTRSAMAALLRAIETSDRPDLKGKLSQTLNQQASNLALLAERPQVDKEKLSHVVDKIRNLNSQFQSSSIKIAEKLRTNPFLKQIKAQFNNPAGACNFSAPAYTSWLHQSDEDRSHDLYSWAQEFNQLNEVVQTILGLTRDSSPWQSAATKTHLYQQSIDTGTSPCHMVRIKVPANLKIYPETSAGKHRLSISFKSLDTHLQKESNFPKQIDFELSLCRI